MRQLSPRRALVFVALALAVVTMAVGASASGDANRMFLPLLRDNRTATAPTGEPWSDPATWGGRLPQAGEAVTIPTGKTVLLDISPPALRSLTINGTLVFAERDLNLSAGWIMLHGRMAVGSPTRPFANQATITLTAADPAENVMQMGTRGLMVMGGRLELFGTAPAAPWLRLNDHAEAGATSLNLERAPGWRPGDRIAIAPTDFYAVGPTELLEVAAVVGSTVQLRSPLQRFRWGELQYVTAGGMSLTRDPSFVPPTPDTPTVLDQRAEVANLTRTIVVQGADDALWRDQGFGAHIMVMAGGVLQIDGAELRRMGQAGRVGRYPIHFHTLSYSNAQVTGDASDNFVADSAIWQSRNRCVVIHGTNGVTIRDNICYNIRGHAFFLEDAVERRNVLEGNLALNIRNQPQADRLQAHEGPVFQGGASGFWLTNPDNTVRRNVAADAEGAGFWLAFPERPLGLHKDVPLTPFQMPFGSFEDNVAHSNREPGLNLDWVPFNDAGEVRPFKYTPVPPGSSANDYDKHLRMAMARITTYKNRGGGFWNRVTKPDYIGWVSADNAGTFFAGAGDNGLISRSLVVGTSLNSRTPYPADAEPPVALASYHSTFDINNNLIVNFPFVDGKPSGAFKTDDYYITAVDKGLVRNPNNLLVGSNPGYRVRPATAENWTLAGALWDPHGYWGPQNNYWVYDEPFFTSGANCSQVLPAGKNGASCNGQYYGVGMFITDYQRDRFSPKIPIEATRVDANGATIGTWAVGDGNLAPKLGNMRHFAARSAGRYILRFPGQPIPREVVLSISNAHRPDDWFLLAVSYSGATTPRVYLTTWYHYAEAATWGAGHFRELYRRDLPAATSLAEVVAASESRYWQDPTNELIWVKVRGGMPYDGSENWQPNSDDALYRPMYLRIFPQP